MTPTSGAGTARKPEIAELVKNAVCGDVNAYGELYKTCLDRIYRYVFWQVGNAMQAEDITEEVFIKAWKAIGSCRGKEHTFVSWLYRVAHNHIVDTLRKHKSDLPLDDNNTSIIADVEHIAESSLQLQEIQKAISTLPEQQRQVILLKFFNEADNNEIEHIMGKKQGAIRALQMRALISLRQRLSLEERTHV